jgi:nicotinamidase-related amidase
MKETPWGVEGTWGADFVKELQPQDEEFVITKRRGSAFYNTDLELYLNSIGANMLVVTGIATDVCVDATVQDAKNRDLNAVILTDCVATDNEKVQDFWLENVFPQSTITMTSEELIEALQKPET